MTGHEQKEVTSCSLYFATITPVSLRNRERLRWLELLSSYVLRSEETEMARTSSQPAELRCESSFRVSVLLWHLRPQKSVAAFPRALLWQLLSRDSALSSLAVTRCFAPCFSLLHASYPVWLLEYCLGQVSITTLVSCLHQWWEARCFQTSSQQKLLGVSSLLILILSVILGHLGGEWKREWLTCLDWFQVSCCGRFYYIQFGAEILEDGFTRAHIKCYCESNYLSGALLL